jgi:hypothetical protein
LDNSGLADGLEDIPACDLEMAGCFAGVVEEDTLCCDVGFAWGEVAPAAAAEPAEERAPVPYFWGDKKDEDDSNEESDYSFNCSFVSTLFEMKIRHVLPRNIHRHPARPRFPDSVNRPAEMRLDVAPENICPKKKSVTRRLVSSRLYHVDR